MPLPLTTPAADAADAAAGDTDEIQLGGSHPEGRGGPILDPSSERTGAIGADAAPGGATPPSETELLLATAALARVLAVSATTEEVVATWVELGGPAVGADFVNIGLLDGRLPDGDDDLSAAHLRTLQPDATDPDIAARYTSIPLAAPVPLTDCIEQGGPVVIHADPAVPERYAALADDIETLGLATFAALPLRRFDGSMLGSIGVGWFGHRRFDDALAARLTTTTEACAAALERCERGDVYRHTVEEIQLAIAPELPVDGPVTMTSVYLPATSHLGFGGDWFDHVPLDDGRFVVVVGDVVGHGTAAAARMIQVRAALAALIDEDCDLAALVRRATDVLQRMTGERDYLATVAVALVDLEGETVTGLTAGHPPPLVVDAHGSMAWMDQARAAPLGLRTLVPEPHTVRFTPGSTLLLYTDGLVERRGEPITAGLERLATTISGLAGPPHDSVDRVVETMLPQPDRRRDDVALVAVHHHA